MSLILLVDLDGVILPGIEDIGTAADEVLQVRTIRGGQTISAQALFPHALMDRHVVTVVEVLLDVGGSVAGVSGGDLDGVIVNLLQTDIFPLDLSGIALGTLHQILLAVDNGEGVIVQEGGHTHLQLGIQLLLEGEDPGIGVDGIAVLPGSAFTQLDLPVVIVNLDGIAHSQIVDPDVVGAILVGIHLPHLRHSVSRGSAGVAVDVIQEVQRSNLGSQIGLVDLAGIGSGGRGGVAAFVTGRCGSVGSVCSIVVAASSSHGQQHHSGHQQSNEFLAHG